MTSLDPRDSRVRGRSRSPGRRDEPERDRSRTRTEEHTEERRTVQAPPPPSIRLHDYDNDSYTSSDTDDSRDRRRSRGYKYEEEKTSTKIVTAEPRDKDRYRDSDRDREPRYSSKYRPDSPPKSHVPGAFDEEEDVKIKYSSRKGEDDRNGRYYDRKEEDIKLRYSDDRGKDYHVEAGYSKRVDRDDRSPGRHSPPEYSARYSETEIRKYSEKVDPRDRERDEKERERERKRAEYERQLDLELEEARKDKEERDKRDQERKRERSASFNLSTAHTAIAAGINISHDDKSKYGRPPPDAPDHPPHGSSYADVKQWEYGQPDEKIKYTKETYTSSSGPYPYPHPPGHRREDSRSGSVSSYDSPRNSKSQIVTVEPGARRRDSPPTGGGLRPHSHSLSVSTGHHGGAQLSIASAPGSPLLEAYRGTYQSISPMPSPLLIANNAHSDLNIIEAISPLDEDERSDRRSRRTARFHDPADEAASLAKALRGDRHGPDTQPLLDILPGLTHDQVMDLRIEYKKIVKTGSEMKGVNIAKHIKMRLKEEDPSMMKACYACALGQWESEAYWANFWYQGEKSRRELLIESLMGRSNREIRAIKDGFSDKKYSYSLTKCMRTELKEDKFKKAVMLVLDERRMDEPRPGQSLDRDLIEDDVRDLHKAVRSEKGGETAMINIIVVRSDAHLREVLRLYESTYRANFAREMLKKSGNLVGELLAHILNGVINKPVRDALLVHHALTLSKSDSIRTELLISRLVRYHWDRPHMEAVKRAYRDRYGIEMQQAVAEGTRGDWGHFCEMLCVKRMSDDVRRVERIEKVEEYRLSSSRR
ncbi:putative Annexin A1 [Xylogone sp. PMI_703]|nr:putative Annexin A1 [Xylogone sp. PMI_703]